MPDRKLYRVDVTIAATAYVKARTKAEANQLAKEALGDHATLEIHDADGEVEVSALPYNSPDLPPVSLSPAMTIHKFGEAEKCNDV